jgi:GNAT superfamily N-acetyltransferase
VHVTISSPRTTQEALALLDGADTGLGSPVARRIVSTEHLTDSFANRNRRPQWVWSATRDGRVVARVAAWGSPDRDLPWIIDLVDIGTEPDRVQLTGQLLTHAAEQLRAGGLDPVELNLHVKVGWRPAPPESPLTDVLDAAKSAGFEVLITRRRFTWTAAAGLPEVGPTLRFEPVGGVDDADLIEAYRRTFSGTLDAHTIRSLQGQEAQHLAVDEVADMAHYAGPPDGWRLAYNGAGELVGLVTGGVQARGMIGYVGVVPEQRGHGYAGQLLSWMTRWLAEHGASEVIGETDDPNRPMGDAFMAVGYREEGGRIDLIRTAGACR